MPSFDVIRRSPIYDSFRVAQCRGMFDIPHQKEIVHKWHVDLPLADKPWLIGLIVGASGSGKSSIAQECFKEAEHHTAFEWSQKSSLLDGFPKSAKTIDITGALCSVGLSSPPTWLKPFAHLSNGQRFRVELARLLVSEHRQIVFDEFTSIVDRDVAKVCCAALAKSIRKKKAPQFIAVSCHSDILDWLQPDWVLDAGTQRFEWRRLRRRPDICLRIYETDVRAWPLFSGHHYLSADIHKASRCFVGCWQDRPVAFTAVLHFPHAHEKKFKREHRTVVLPDYQGVGIGNAMSEAVGAHFKSLGFRYISTTSHPAMIWHRAKSPKWRCHRKHGHVAGSSKNNTAAVIQDASRSRLTAGFEYIGEDSGFQDGKNFTGSKRSETA